MKLLIIMRFKQCQQEEASVCGCPTTPYVGEIWLGRLFDTLIKGLPKEVSSESEQ